MVFNFVTMTPDADPRDVSAEVEQRTKPPSETIPTCPQRADEGVMVVAGISGFPLVLPDCSEQGVTDGRLGKYLCIA